MGAFSWGKFDLFAGKVAATSYYANQWRVSDQRTGDTVDVAIKTGLIWGTGTAYRLTGWGIRYVGGVVVVNPVTVAITYAYVAGAIASDVIDPEEGLDNYLGFTTGGGVGNQPNYLTGDENNSGYFNVAQNMSAIFESNRSKLDAAVQRQAEQTYIDSYWEAKAAANFESMVMIYNELTPAQQNQIQSEIKGRYWILR